MNNVFKLCESFLNKTIDLVELQERLETLIVPNELNGIFWKLYNQLEEIRFTKLESNFHEYGEPIVRDFLQKLPHNSDL